MAPHTAVSAVSLPTRLPCGTVFLEAIALNQGTPLPLQPKIKKITHITRNMKNKIFAIPADAAAIPPNPNTAAIRAIIKKVTAQPNMFSPPLRTESH
jgi:hypothetical protein